MALKIGIHVVAHNVAQKKPDVLFAKARHVVREGSLWSLSFPNPLPTGSKILARKPSLKPQSVSPLTRKEFENPPAK